ncbi:hypothetical protein [Nonomuraea sp. bgisy094]|uniref:hypothetical protein n=1 Tax=Nonomuraea sp. bgisy094 TaxID=3413781 RepID=UPI003EBF1B09
MHVVQRGPEPQDWVTEQPLSPIIELRGFASDLRRDWAAVTAGPTAARVVRRWL